MNNRRRRGSADTVPDMSPAVIRKQSVAPAEVVVGPGNAGLGQVLGDVLVGPRGFDPLAGYPAENFDPAAHGFSPAGEGLPVYAGTIGGTTWEGVPVDLFCVDIATATAEGCGYAGETWAASGIAHLGSVARVLASSYPRTAEPVTANGDAQRAAAVQLAVWFFTDRVVVGSISPLFPLVATIVSTVLATGPQAEPARRPIARAATGTLLRYRPANPTQPNPTTAQRLILVRRKTR
jgi:TQXA domain-containing protein